MVQSEVPLYCTKRDTPVWFRARYPCMVQSEAVPKVQFYLTECITGMVLESHLPHKIVNSSFPLVKENNKLPILRGSGLSKSI